MLPGFVIGLREGIEASLIVGILATFLVKAGRRDALRPTWIGVAIAILLCTGLAVALAAVNSHLPQREQERFETIVAGVAVVLVSSMIVWMCRHARSLRGSLEASASAALASGSALALVVMAFIAVLREGVETSVFLVAVFQHASSALLSGGGALLGIAASIAIGYGIYRGGVHLNLARFFRITSLLLVLVAAGLVSSALHTANEGGWLNSLQGQALDVSAVVAPGSVRASLITGMFGLQPQPTVAEVIGWLAFAVPMAVYVLWPARRAGGGGPSVRCPATDGIPA